MQKLDLEKLIFGEEAPKPIKPLRAHWIVLAVVIALVLTAVFWPKDRAGAIYGEKAPDMISWRTMDKETTGLLYRADYVLFTPKLDGGKWDAEKISFSLQAESGTFLTNVSSADPNNLTVASGKSATWVPMEETTEDYVTVIAWAGEHIVGYALVKIQPGVGDADMFTPMYQVELLGSAIFPLAEGEFQDVTEEYVQQQIEELKKQ